MTTTATTAVRDLTIDGLRFWAKGGDTYWVFYGIGERRKYVIEWREIVGRYRLDAGDCITYRETLADVALAIREDWER